MIWSEFDKWLKTCPGLTYNEISLEGALHSYGIERIKLRHAAHPACIVQMSFLVSGIPAEKEEKVTSRFYEEDEE